MNNSEKYNEAKRTVAKKMGFYRHLLTYIVVIALLVVINLTTSPKYLWFIWPMAGWGIGIFSHYIRVFLSSGRMMDRMIQRELEQIDEQE